MAKIKDIYDNALDLMIKSNEPSPDIPPEDLETLNILLTGFINNLNFLLIKSLKNANNKPDPAKKAGSRIE